MPDIKFILPGPDTITLSGQTADKLIRTGDGDAALLYLYILRTRGQCSPDEAAAALDKHPGAIASAMAVLSRLGLVQFDGADAPKTGANPGGTGFAPEAGSGEAKGNTEYSGPDIEAIRREMENGSAFSSVVEEAQRSLGKILSPDELQRLFGIYDSLRLPPEVILQLITHCITECRRRSGRNPTMRYIEKAAYTWEREGIFSLDRAEEYLKALDLRRSALGEVKQALQIKDRELSATERRYVDEWLTMGFGADAVEIAYDRTVMKTGKLAWDYMNSIMKSWYGKGLNTPEEILAKDTRTAQNSGRGGDARREQAQKQKFGAPTPEELNRMARLLEKIKEV